MQNLVKNLESHLALIEQKFSNDLHALRTDRANPALVEEIVVDAYQSRMKIKELASVTIPEARVIVIQPWDKSIISAVNKALEVSDLGTSPVIQGEIIRIVLPSMNEERRKELTKLVGKKIEEAKISIRQAREGAIKVLDEQQKENIISEDEKFKTRDVIQKKVDACQQRLISLGQEKENEILTI
ncbi:MAG: ribosome recycling factor [Candidatus Terrybacteria bacterium RIFCSPLOWO2_01_FULL_44_24]|uniref:Ribosome-recycling factor n=1 Tax=Candidatus Terrybacteria bacterium RIFCSPHIGHO2_01_FULL_43_35 TaxID=1802361 RepID=A0A1G2PHP8_9BACT|nr:MAG: ribosome recycling factor [Candidatus Terrybacteria bacterium RIFCSPHIGHO2_01_FULL_43_35]OHA49973.1 MAG: ribosome recycling factor [Candidatus Terrybacteria bacterium RIFCSPHIGHO2_02_FULL_43_14]OHA51796.1 MAG: ribosome recycling factor [Candidatus Terrybacteria bacterium RIFCSPLOWO2_01_FULL_44_24]